MFRPVAITLVCEDVRLESSGKTTIVGVLTDNLALPTVPSALPKLCFYTKISIPIDFKVTSISTWLRFSTGSEEAREDFNPDLVARARAEALEKRSPSFGYISTVMASPFVIENEMSVQAITCINGEEILSGYINLIVQAATA